VRRLAIAAVALAIVLAIAPLPNIGAQQAGGLRAGVGVGDLTPPIGTPMFAYTAREAAASGVTPFIDQASFDTNLYAKTFVASTGVHTRVRARALVLERGGVKLALVALDLGGMPYELHQAVANRIGATGIDRDHLLMSVTHSHGSVGPIWPTTHSGYALLGGDAYDPRVFGHVVDGVVDAITAANASLAAAKVGIAQIDVLDATNNRNLGPHRLNDDEPHVSRGDDKPHSLPSTMTVVRADRADGRPLGQWTAFAIHGTSFGDEMLHFTGDNQAFAERMVEEEIRRRANLPADAVVVHALANGTEGDISPRGAPAYIGEVPLALPPESYDGLELSTWVTSDFAGAESAGSRVARAALIGWEQAGRNMRDDLALDARFTLYSMVAPSVNGEPVGTTVALGCGGVVCPDGTALPVDVPGQGSKVPVALSPPGVLAPAFAPLQTLRIGDLIVATTPFETTKQMGVRIARAVAQAAAPIGSVRVANAGMANGYLSYMATPEEYDAEYYEGSFTLYGRQQGPHVQNGLVALASALVTGAPAPAGLPEQPSTAIVIDDLPPLLGQPDPTTVIAQPANVVRFGQTRFVWTGGDPAVDDPHVSVERHLADGSWSVVTTDDSFEDLVSYRHPNRFTGNEWTHTWEPSVCTALGEHRIVVRGTGVDGPYEVISAPFTVAASAPATPAAVTVEPGVAWFRAAFPEPGDDSLRLRPRVASGGGATVELRAAEGSVRRLAARWVPQRLRYEVTGAFAAGSAAAVVDGTFGDGCGNGAAVYPAATEAGPPGGGPLPATGGQPWVLTGLALLVLAAAVSSKSRSRAL
jgi:neutral ceramidase